MPTQILTGYFACEHFTTPLLSECQEKKKNTIKNNETEWHKRQLLWTPVGMKGDTIEKS